MSKEPKDIDVREEEERKEDKDFTSVVFDGKVFSDISVDALRQVSFLSVISKHIYLSLNTRQPLSFMSPASACCLLFIFLFIFTLTCFSFLKVVRWFPKSTLIFHDFFFFFLFATNLCWAMAKVCVCRLVCMRDLLHLSWNQGKVKKERNT